MFFPPFTWILEWTHLVPYPYLSGDLEQALKLIRKNLLGMGLQIFQASGQKPMIKPLSPKARWFGRTSFTSCYTIHTACFFLFLSNSNMSLELLHCVFVKVAICLFPSRNNWVELPVPSPTSAQWHAGGNGGGETTLCGGCNVHQRRPLP